MTSFHIFPSLARLKALLKTIRLLLSNISLPLELKKLCDIGYSSDLSDCPGDCVGHRRAGKTPTHPGYGDPASGV